jgi:hypothetical protein
MGKKRADFVNRSTIIQIASFPFFSLAKPNTKSIVISSRFHWVLKRIVKAYPIFDVLPLFVDIHHI